jgi:hypothetical protein
MTEREPMAATDVPVLPPDGEAALLSSLQSLRSEGARHLDPVRFRYVELLARRMQVAPDAVRRILHGKLQQGLANCGERLEQLQSAHPVSHDGNEVPRATTASQRPDTPLTRLNCHIEAATRNAAPGNAEGALSGTGHARPELKSVHRFREAWSRICAEDELDRAIGRGPENAGPLNSHMLMLRSLTLMRDLSPDYLRRFLSQADSLLWLDQARRNLGQPATRPKATRQSRSRK